MAKLVDRAGVRRMIASERAQLVDVLPQDEFETEHIAGAVNLPLKELNEATARRFDAERPLIVYCNDFL